jgi:hypothetical protein
MKCKHETVVLSKQKRSSTQFYDDHKRRVERDQADDDRCKMCIDEENTECTYMYMKYYCAYHYDVLMERTLLALLNF